MELERLAALLKARRRDRAAASAVELAPAEVPPWAHLCLDLAVSLTEKQVQERKSSSNSNESGVHTAPDCKQKYGNKMTMDCGSAAFVP